MLIVRSLIIGREGSGSFNGQTPMLFSIFPFDVAHENFSSFKVLLMVNLPFCSEFFVTDGRIFFPSHIYGKTDAEKHRTLTINRTCHR